jgi:hypothetical protein
LRQASLRDSPARRTGDRLAPNLRKRYPPNDGAQTRDPVIAVRLRVVTQHNNLNKLDKASALRIWLQAYIAVRARFQTVLNVGILESTSFTICRILLYLFLNPMAKTKNAKLQVRGPENLGLLRPIPNFFHLFLD